MLYVNIPFRFLEDPVPETNVYRSKQLSDGSVIIDKDIEWANLEMELQFLKAKLDIKDIIINYKDIIMPSRFVCLDKLANAGMDTTGFRQVVFLSIILTFIRQNNAFLVI